MEVNSTSESELHARTHYNRKFRIYHRHMLKRLPFADERDISCREYINGISCSDQLLYDIYMLIDQTENGLLSQWLSNPFGDRYDLTVDHLHKIGAPKAKAVLLKLKYAFPSGYIPFSQSERQDVIYSMSDKEEESTYELYSDQLLMECEDLFDLAARYIEALGDSEEKLCTIGPGRW